MMYVKHDIALRQIVKNIEAIDNGGDGIAYNYGKIMDLNINEINLLDNSYI